MDFRVSLDLKGLHYPKSWTTSASGDFCGPLDPCVTLLSITQSGAAPEKAGNVNFAYLEV